MVGCRHRHGTENASSERDLGPGTLLVHLEEDLHQRLSDEGRNACVVERGHAAQPAHVGLLSEVDHREPDGSVVLVVLTSGADLLDLVHHLQNRGGRWAHGKVHIGRVLGGEARDGVVVAGCREEGGAAVLGGDAHARVLVADGDDVTRDEPLDEKLEDARDSDASGGGEGVKLDVEAVLAKPLVDRIDGLVGAALKLRDLADVAVARAVVGLHELLLLLIAAPVREEVKSVFGGQKGTDDRVATEG